MSKRKARRLKSEIIKDIHVSLTELRDKRFVRDEMGLSIKDTGSTGCEISFEGKSDINNIMYDIHMSTASIMDKLLREQQYTVLLYDKSIVQAEFIIQNGEIAKERLLFLKKHNKIWKLEEINVADAEDRDWFDNEEGIPICIRIDYDPENHVECDHAATHLTLSNNEKCRIPIQNVITFSEFIRFILLHFYGEKLDIPQYRIEQDNTITELERKMIHIGWK